MSESPIPPESPDDTHYPDIEDMATSFTEFLQRVTTVYDMNQDQPTVLIPSDNLFFQSTSLSDLQLSNELLESNPFGEQGFENILQQSMNDETPFKTVLDDTKENGIKYDVVEDGEEITCCFAQALLEDGDQIATLPCGHTFERHSIMHWLNTESAECPVCRKSLVSKEIRYEPPIVEPEDNLSFSLPLSLESLINDTIQRTVEREEEMALQMALMASLDMT